MASASNAFKMKCPSCEAGVTIRDASLVGKKVDCPKCKFRFVVEAPAEAVDDEDAEKSADDKKVDKAAAPKGKAKAAGAAPKSKNKPLPQKIDDEVDAEKKPKGSNRTVLIGGGLGVLAIAILVIGFFTGLFGGDEDASAPAKPGGQQAKGQPAKKNPVETKGTEATVAKTETPKVKETPVDLVRNEITNMLPEDSEWVMRLSGPEFLKTPVGAVLFEKSSESAPAFRRWMGFGGEDVEKFACSGGKNGAFFSVTRFKTDHTIDDIRNAMQLDPTPLYINQRTMFTIKSNELFKILSPYITAKLNALGVTLPKSEAPMALCLVDPRSLVIGDQAGLDRFLKLKDRKRTYQTTYIRPDQVETTPPPKKGDKTPEPKEGEPKTDETAKKDIRASFTSNESFLSVDPGLKIMVNQLEADKTAVLSVARKFDNPGAFFNSLVGGLVPPGLPTPKAPIVGIAVRRLDDNRLDVAAGIEFERSDEAIGVALKLQPFIPGLAKIASAKFQVPITGGEREPENPANPKDNTLPDRTKKDVTDTGKKASDSTLSINAADRYLIARLDVDWSPVYYEHINPTIRSAMDLLKGEAVMMSGQAHWHSLAGAVKSMGQAGAVPVAAFPRPVEPARFGMPYPPEQRVGWMADLLPYLGYQTLSQSVRREEAWNSAANLLAGEAWVPEFLSRENPETTWRALVPSLNGRDLGATHFVGLTGVGMDAANYPDRPEFAKKLGVFGYERQTKFADISAGDGLANTIFMIQVPPNIQRAWIRGGGSTAQGVPETGSIKPFISVTKDGKKGTYALMADGSIRFLSETINDEVFKALSTYKGGEKIDNLDRIAPAESVEAKLTSPAVPKK